MNILDLSCFSRGRIQAFKSELGQQGTYSLIGMLEAARGSARTKYEIYTCYEPARALCLYKIGTRS